MTRPKLLVLDEPTEGIQPSIIKDIGRAISYLRTRARWRSCWSSNISTSRASWRTGIAVMERGEVVESGDRHDLGHEKIRKRLAI